MAEFPALPLWTDAYLGDTTHLTTIEHGAYLLLLMAMWRTSECALPNDDKLLARIARCSPAQWARIKPILTGFFKLDGDRITQSRLTDERNAVKRNSKRQSDRVKSRWLKNKKTEDTAVVPERYQTDTSLTLTTVEEKEDTNVSSKKKISAPRGSRLPPDWRLPMEWGLWAVESGLPEAKARAEADRFRDYWVGKSGREAIKLDWFATWRNWIRKAIETHGRAAPPVHEVKFETWGIPDAEPVRTCGGAWDKPAEEAAGAADLPSVQSPPQGAEPESSVPFGDDDAGWVGGDVPSLFLVQGGVL